MSNRCEHPSKYDDRFQCNNVLPCENPDHAPKPGDPRAKAIEAMARAMEQEGLVLTDTREAERLRCDFCGGAEGDFYRKALGKVAGEWHARGTDGVRFGCSCPEFAREALSPVPVEEEESDG